MSDQQHPQSGQDFGMQHHHHDEETPQNVVDQAANMAAVADIMHEFLHDVNFDVQHSELPTETNYTHQDAAAVAQHDPLPAAQHDPLPRVVPVEVQEQPVAFAAAEATTTPITASSASAETSTAGQKRALDRQDSSDTRSDRKRAREKQRRADVNQKFEELTTVLKTIEEASTGNASPTIPGNRVDLIARTIRMLEHLSSERMAMQKRSKDLEDELARSRKAGEEMATKLKSAMTQPVSAGKNQMLMMVPMLVNNQQQAVGAPAAPAAAAPTSSSSPAAASAPSAEAVVAAPSAMPPFMHPGMAAPAMMMGGGMMPFAAAAPTTSADGAPAAAAAAMPTMTPWGPMMMPTVQNPMMGGMAWPMAAQAPATAPAPTAPPTMAVPNPASDGNTSSSSNTAVVTNASSSGASSTSNSGGNNNSPGKPGAVAEASGAPGNYAHCA